MSIPDDSTGFIKRITLWPHFENLELPPRGRRRRRLLPDKTLRYELERSGAVSIYEGVRRIGSIEPGLGSQVFAFLFDRPGQSIAVLDLQAAAAGLLDLRELDDPSRAYLDDWDIDPRSLPADTRRRLGALCRRLELYATLPDDTSDLPKWAANPDRRLRKLEDELRAQLAERHIPANFPPIKNAGRVLRRALMDALENPCFDDLRERFTFGDVAVYTSG